MFMFAKGKIMVVDDEADVRDVIKLQLEQRGLNVLEAVDGQNAIDLLKSGDNMVNCGVILCDIRMPKVNGVEFIQFMREQAPGIPIVVITGYPDLELESDLLKKGVKCFLVKPNVNYWLGFLLDHFAQLEFNPGILK